MPSRRTRRRRERERAKRPPREKLSLQSRVVFVLGGMVMVAAGVALLALGGNNNRLFRVDGVLIVAGLGITAAGVFA